MGSEINLMRNYPTSNRKVLDRGGSKTQKDQEIARKFGEEFFDLYERYQNAGSPYHGIPRQTAKLGKND